MPLYLLFATEKLSDVSVLCRLASDSETFTDETLACITVGMEVALEETTIDLLSRRLSFIIFLTTVFIEFI